MTRPLDLLREGRKDELWQMCCGFLNLSLEQFMAIQKRLLLEEIELLKNSELGRRMLGGAMPETIEEFREQVPLTTYSDYLPELVEKREDVLPTKPAMWVHTVGRIGEYNFKWVPLPERFLYEFERVAGGIGLLASCNPQGDFLVKEHLKTLATMAARDYGSGIVAYLMQQALGFDLLPSNTAEMTFQERVEAGFEQALSEGLDAFGGLPSVLAYVGEMFKQGKASVDTRFLLSHPRALACFVKGLVKSRLARRPLLPKDLWSVRVVVGGGADSAIFQDKVEELWGRKPLEIYGATEGGLFATQTWDHAGMTFIPNLNFFEFIPEREWFKWQLDHSYQPKTILLDQVKAGEKYELVLTNFHGGIMTRYRIGDIIEITSLRNEQLNIDIPQMVFHSRADDLMDIAGLGRLTERVIGEAIESSGIPYVDWVARKEIIDNKPVLHIYPELGAGYIASDESVATAIREQFKKLDRKYRSNFYRLIGDMETVLNLKPVEITLLPQGAFSSYIAQRQSEGAALENLKPPRVNPSDEVLSVLRAPKVMVEAAPATAPERAAA
ncbi:MAG TPA: GH3 auxin-responsive promoter family protein [Dehalococcoidia bacterium]|nr:GH3 auxin-responsive promoter family protein [Dehalococcoidia bacterium]